MAASTTATATMAAAGFDKRSSSASSLQTPGSGGFPSEMMKSPLAASPGMMKQKADELKTPITPPSAYLDFLKNMSPALMSPAMTGTSARFSFTGENLSLSDTVSDTSTQKPSISPPTSQPALSRNTSYDSNSSIATISTTQSAVSSSTASSLRRQRPESPRVTTPPSPFLKPALRSSRTPRKLTIPQSPYSGGGLPSARSISSPYPCAPLSATPWSASYSPRDVDTEVNGKPGKIMVKQVVTRTVTYCRTPLEAVPDGNLWKRRKVEHEESSADDSEEPAVKEQSTPIKEEKEDKTPTVATKALLPPSSTADSEDTKDV